MKLSRSFSKFVCAAALLAASSIAVYAAAPPSVNLSPPQAQAKQLNSTMPERAVVNYTLKKTEAPPAVVMCDNTIKGVMLGVADIGPSIGLPAFKNKVADDYPPRWMISGAPALTIPTLWRPSYALNTDVTGVQHFNNSSDTVQGTGRAFALTAASRDGPTSLGFA